MVKLYVDAGTDKFPATVNKYMESVAERLNYLIEVWGYTGFSIPYPPPRYAAGEKTDISVCDIIRLQDEEKVLHIVVVEPDFEIDMACTKFLVRVQPENRETTISVRGKFYGNVLIMRTADVLPTISGDYTLCTLMTETELLTILEKARQDKEAAMIISLSEGRMLALKQRHKDSYDRLYHHRMGVVAAAKEYEEISGALAAIELKSTTSHIESMVAELRSSAKLKSFDVLPVGRGNSLSFTTAPISVVDSKGREHPIGSELYCTINLETSDLRIHNKVNNYMAATSEYTSKLPHPHVSAEGVPCLGSIATILPELVASGDIVGIWQVVLSYLESYNADDVWGKRLRFWPALKEDGTTEMVEDVSSGEGTCPNCGAEIGDDGYNRIHCETCGAEGCDDCFAYSENAEEWLCREHSFYCDACETVHKIDIEHTYCSKCGGLVCYDFIDARKELVQVTGPIGETYNFCGKSCRNAHVHEIMYDSIPETANVEDFEPTMTMGGDILGYHRREIL